MKEQPAPKADALPGCAIPRQSVSASQNSQNHRDTQSELCRDAERNSTDRAAWEQEVPENSPSMFSSGDSAPSHPTPVSFSDGSGRGLDLSHFCYTEDDRPYLKQPWSRGDFTYATNGHLAVRVPRREDIPENDQAPDVEGRIIAKLTFDDLRPIIIPRLPPLRFFMLELDELLEVPYTALTSECARFAGALFNLRYVHLLCWLPGLKMGPPADAMSPSPFGFDGGVGCLMPMKEIKDRPPVYDFGDLPARTGASS